MKRLLKSLLVVLVFPIFAAGIEQIAEVTHPQLGEMSGIVASTYEDIYWVHNDSGDSSRIFAIKANGSVVLPRLITTLFPNRSTDAWEGYSIDNAWHQDWEDIAIDNGVLFVADVGNNLNARRDLGVYVVNEPNPYNVHKTRAVKFLPIRYPDQLQYPATRWHFDCEAIFTFGGKLYFLTKHRESGKLITWEPGTKLYRLDTLHTDQDNVLTLVDHHSAVTSVTAADISPDSDRLAILTYGRLWVFDRPTHGDKWLQSDARVLDFDPDFIQQNEGVAFETNQSVLISNENRAIFRVSLDALSPIGSSNNTTD